MISAGIIGVSGFGAVHYQDLMRLRERGEASLVAAAVINQDEEAGKCGELRRIGCRLYSDYREMLRDFAGRLDLCCIPTGIAFHAEMAAAALRSGCNVFMEKPATATIDELDALQALEKETGRWIAIGFQHVYQPEIQRIKREILDGRLGRLRRIVCIGCWPRDRRYYARNGWAGRIRVRGRWVLDSPANNALAHYLNLSCFLAGPGFPDTADLQELEAGLYRANPEIENFDTVMLRLACAGQARILFLATHASEQTSGPFIRIACENGSALWSPGETRFSYADGTAETIPNGDGTALREHVSEAVLRRLRDPDAGALVCGLRIARAHTIAVNAAQTAAPVIPVRPEEVRRLALDDGNHRFVWTGIDGLLRRLADEDRLPAPSDGPSFVAPARISLAGYRSFSLNPSTRLLPDA